MHTREEIEATLDKMGLFFDGLVDAVYALVQPAADIAEAIAKLVAEAAEESYATAKRQPTRHPIRTEKCKNMNRGYRYCFRPVYLARGRC